ncbi:SsrA-binding protein [Candidatus Uhrbacteria bacterium RIFCSPHIGHO2_02_FULL_60_10]|uniref:SsrA-binding protein n=1 Tax=Candidatus Uhrbacteria bacterium RIFCSPHIGHO2_02_FULL_60_10 TaxID=1802392 RepID=A0A1F7U6D2_9BACT|nr:MAG: SsrA-binding protein [Candidatus Uhrbacteria bacterium RIFCSPHIGHO2_02_FULL_60_10]
MPTLAANKRIRYDYEILESFEAGLQLTGQEVKQVRAGFMKLQGAYVTMHGGEAFLLNAHVPKYPPAGPLPSYDPYRSRRLLLHRRELLKILGKLAQKGLTLVPLSVYTKGSRIKIEIGIARGKKQFEKREDIKKKETDREIRRSLKG